jgi:hypothetical protein
LERLWRFITKDRNLTPRQKICIVAVVISVIAAIIFLGLFPSSFVYLDYHEVRTFTCRISVRVKIVKSGFESIELPKEKGKSSRDWGGGGGLKPIRLLQ